MIALTLAILFSVDFREESRVNCTSDEHCEDALSLLKEARLQWVACSGGAFP